MPEPFAIQIEFPIPEVGALAGDWIVSDPDDDHIQIVRAVPRHQVASLIQRFQSTSGLLGRALDAGSSTPPRLELA